MSQKPLTNHEMSEVTAMRAAGKNWREIGVLLADKRGRKMPYTDDYVRRAHKSFVKGGSPAGPGCSARNGPGLAS